MRGASPDSNRIAQPPSRFAQPAAITRTIWMQKTVLRVPVL